MKYSRHSKILEIIECHEIETQEELAQKLLEYGQEVTQATISRDIKDLKLVKIMTGEGKYRYTAINRNDNPISDKLLSVFAQAFMSCDYANNIVVIKTLPGMAQASASALDALDWPGIIGTIAGDDTLMVVCRAEIISEKLVDRLNQMAENNR